MNSEELRLSEQLANLHLGFIQENYHYSDTLCLRRLRDEFKVKFQ